MSRTAAASSWTPAVKDVGKPVYRAIADAIESDISTGILVPGARLPTQRALADRLGIDFTTVTRAYSEARRRGLLEGLVGQGTYVRRAVVPVPRSPGGVADTSMNLPPRFDDVGLVARMWKGISALQAEGGIDLLLRYQEPGGTRIDREAGSNWLGSRLSGVAPERTLVCPGAQNALLVIAGILAAPGDAICVEELTYPGFRAVAAQLNIRLVGIRMDEEGAVPAQFEKICSKYNPKAFYCTPTLHNPTTITMPVSRRKALIAVARRFQVPIIEDDAYGALPQRPLVPMARLAPELVYCVSSLSKCLAPALRIAYLSVPTGQDVTRVTAAIRATAATASPLTAAIATRWINEGTADAVLAAVRKETALRQAIVARTLPSENLTRNADGFHVWLRLPSPWTRGAFDERMRSSGIGLVGSDAFALQDPPEAVRLGLGVPRTRSELTNDLQTIASILGQAPVSSSIVV